jgi:putative PIN family toxin of toxin-antitoxin system
VIEVPRVVFDTNILFSAVGWMGNPYHCVQAARQGQCLFLTCEAILEELREKLRLKRDLSASKAAEITDEICAFSKIVSPPGTLKVISADPDDDAILECAVVGQATHLVSGDRHLLALEKYQNIQIVQAAAFLKLLQAGSKYR